MEADLQQARRHPYPELDFYRHEPLSPSSYVCACQVDIIRRVEVDLQQALKERRDLAKQEADKQRAWHRKLAENRKELAARMPEGGERDHARLSLNMSRCRALSIGASSTGSWLRACHRGRCTA